MMLFRGNTLNLQVSIQDVPQLLWSIKPFTTCQVSSSVSACHLLCRNVKQVYMCSTVLILNQAVCYQREAMLLHLLGFLCSIKALSSARFPLSYMVTSKPKDSSKGHSGRSPKLTISSTRTHSLTKLIMTARHTQTHTHIYIVVIYPGVYMLHVLFCPVMFIPSVTSY